MISERRHKRLTAILENRSVPEPNTGCVLWLGRVDRKGYARVDFDETSRAHRAAWILANGPVPPGLFVCHKCDVRSCINVQHLFLGTQEENMADMVAKGRSGHGERAGTAMLTWEDVTEARRRATEGESSPELAREYGVTRDYMRRIIDGKAWRSLAERVAKPRPRPLSPAAVRAAEDMRERAAQSLQTEIDHGDWSNTARDMLMNVADAIRLLPLK